MQLHTETPSNADRSPWLTHLKKVRSFDSKSTGKCTFSYTYQQLYYVYAFYNRYTQTNQTNKCKTEKKC